MVQRPPVRGRPVVRGLRSVSRLRRLVSSRLGRLVRRADSSPSRALTMWFRMTNRWLGSPVKRPAGVVLRRLVFIVFKRHFMTSVGREPSRRVSAGMGLRGSVGKTVRIVEPGTRLVRRLERLVRTIRLLKTIVERPMRKHRRLMARLRKPMRMHGKHMVRLRLVIRRFERPVRCARRLGVFGSVGRFERAWPMVVFERVGRRNMRIFERLM